MSVSSDPESLRAGRHPVSLERLTYATVVLMSVLVMYDGWNKFATFLGASVVIIAPIIALALAHLFSEVLQAYADLQRPLTGGEWRWYAMDQVQLLVVTVPPLVVLVIGQVSALDARSTISVIVWTGLVALVGLASVAAWRAGFRGVKWIAIALSGGLVGLVIISLQVLLKPH